MSEKALSMVLRNYFDIIISLNLIFNILYDMIVRNFFKIAEGIKQLLENRNLGNLDDV